MSKRDDKTFDLLSWQPPSVVPQVDLGTGAEAQLRRDQISLAVAATLRECRMSREEIRRRMEEFLGEPVSLGSLNAYASQAREDATISALRLSALAWATGDYQAFQLLVAPGGHSVVPDQYLPAIDEAMIRVRLEELEEMLKIKRRQWRGVRR